jgi:hypothetical protein
VTSRLKRSPVNGGLRVSPYRASMTIYVWDRWPQFFRGRLRVLYEITREVRYAPRRRTTAGQVIRKLFLGAKASRFFGNRTKLNEHTLRALQTPLSPRKLSISAP